jgi:hypothetical protein
MPTLQKLPTRHPVVPHRAVPLTDGMAATQLQNGWYTTQRGVRYPIPFDHSNRPTVFLHRDLWRQDGQGRVSRPGVRMEAPGSKVQYKALSWLRDHVNQNIPYWYYMATLGHDLHVSTFGNLYARHFHAGWANPFDPDRVAAPLDPTFETFFATHYRDHDCRLGERCPKALGITLADMQKVGFVEDLGWLSGGKVTDIFVSEEIDELVSAAGSEYADFDSHEVGTSTQVESNNDTALIATTSIARAAGTPTDADPIYRSVGTITADATESWEEHGLFNNTTGAALMDRSLTGGQSVNSSDQVQYTYELTKNPEA